MAINSILPFSNLLPFIHFFQNKQKLFFIVSFSKFYNFPKEFMAQRTGEKKLVVAKNIAIFAQKLFKKSIWPIILTSSLGYDLFGKTIKFEVKN